ncbi:MAG: hemerythrin domain-containing protein [Candidatus Thermoplasmatota archaeon]|nr:hemerythrin domain-containing protein [Candidatus Thermoplasmatota archaeon]
MKILIADENRAARTLLENQMDVLGHEIEKIEDEDELIDALKKKSFDMLFLSWTLPGKSGLELTKRIRKGLEGKKPYIILMAPEEREKLDLLGALEAGANEFLVKPLNKDLIRSRMKKAKIALDIEERGLTIRPLNTLKNEHESLRRMADIVEVVHFNIKKDAPENLLDWIASASQTLEQDIHHKKEKFYLVSFLENAMEEQGEGPSSRLFSRTSIKRIEEEHEKLEKMVKRLQHYVKGYKKGEISPKKIRDLLKEYKKLLRNHLEREEKYLFPLTAKYMDKETSKELMQRFDNIDESVGKEKLEKIEREMLQKKEKVEKKA